MGTGRHPVHGLFVAVDGDYFRLGGARAAAVAAADAALAQVLTERTEVVPKAEPYRPGQFYRRELPAVRAVLCGISGLKLLVVDEYADIDPVGRPGLGAHAHEEFGIPVTGVAKLALATATHAIPVLQATSKRPVFVSAAGLPRADAAELVRLIAGQPDTRDTAPRDKLARTSTPEAVQRQPPGQGQLRRPDLHGLVRIVKRRLKKTRTAST